jgi:ribosomal protein L33
MKDIIGELYLFDGQCDWSKKHTLAEVGAMCAHEDCHKSFYYNMAKYEIMERLQVNEYCPLCKADIK